MVTQLVRPHFGQLPRDTYRTFINKEIASLLAFSCSPYDCRFSKLNRIAYYGRHLTAHDDQTGRLLSCWLPVYLSSGVHLTIELPCACPALLESITI